MSPQRGYGRRHTAVSDHAQADQLGAARRETARLADRLAAQLRCEPTRVLNRWAIRFVADRTARLALRDPTLATCRHVAGPVPLLMPSWAGVVVCSACVDLIPLAEGDEDSRCDGCREIVEKIHPTAMASATAIVLGGLCGRCLEATKASAA